MIRHLAPALLLALAATAQAQTPGASLESLLDYARSRNPEYAAMRYEAEAAAERIVPAGALPDPKFRTELRDITRMGEQNPSVLPARVGSTRYLLMQDVPWLGKRELKREIAELDARAADGRATGTWAELSARIKTAYAQYQYIHHNAALTRELLDLSTRLEKVAQARYAGGLAAQQDVIRAQIEQTGMRTELLALDNEDRQARARVNTLLARPASAPLEAPTSLRPLPPAGALD
ncbi:TolC family protein, partial [Zoogloea oryzae]|uniref:TolC family protein n=1 Tax=Zoogloea oryzae TaxID=310767 RepID=UPI0024E052B3